MLEYSETIRIYEIKLGINSKQIHGDIQGQDHYFTFVQSHPN